MIAKKYRPHFHVLFLTSEPNELSDTIQYLEKNECSIRTLSNSENLKSEIESHPPHIICFMYGDRLFAEDHVMACDTLLWLKTKLPEVHLICMAQAADFQSACGLFETGLYDCLRFPLDAPMLLLRAMDRAIDAELMRYTNETEKHQLAPVAFDLITQGLIEIWDTTIKNLNTEDEVLDLLLSEIAKTTNENELLYLKYVPGTCALVVERGRGWSVDDMAGVGIDLKSTETHFSPLQLRDPSQLAGLQEFVSEGLRRPNYIAYPLLIENMVHGILILIRSQPAEEMNRLDSFIKICISLSAHRLTEIRLKSKLEKHSVVDDDSDALNRQFLMLKIREEVTRARRISQPVSLLIIQVDSFHDFVLVHDSADVERFLKSLTSLVRQNSRPTDLFGRLTDNQFALVLPHTDRRGGAIKGERLRRIIEGADFSRVISEETQITVSIGVSEYPSICHNSSDLLRTADEALSDVIRTSRNKVCLARERVEFVPDFSVRSSR